jgi:NhaP-type Na+/H+ or K+/H+ antiporter
VEGLFVTVITLLIVAFALNASRVTQVHLSAPIVFGVAGALLAGPVDVGIDRGSVLLLAELTLVVILFHDASTVQLRQLRNDKGIALRLLAIGFPLTLGLTYLAARGLIPEAGVAGAVLLAGALTPTDAGLGAATIMNPQVPVRVRRALNVESGLNDGLATPVVLLAIGSLATAEEALGESPGAGVVESGPGASDILQIGVVPALVGVAVGVIIGVVFAKLLDISVDRDASTHRSRAIAVVALPVLALGGAEMLQANAFIAAFVCGITFGSISRCLAAEPEAADTLEIGADMLGFVIWFLAGGLVVSTLSDGIEWQWLAMAVLALTVLRTLPVAISMVGTGFHRQTLLFVGWFGPRGLATVVFGLIAFEELGPGGGDIAGVLALTVSLSVVLHGATAGPWAARYGTWARRVHAPVEMEPATEPTMARGRSRR